MIQQTTIELHPAVDEIDGIEAAGDPYAELEEHTCLRPGGHVFKTSCGETKCLYCSEVAWS